MKNTKMLFASGCLLALTTSVFATSTPAKANMQVSPFTDNININLKDFPQETISVSYQKQNDVNINGPRNVLSSAGAFPLQISSNNSFDNGYPSLSISENKASCKITFVDGPWTDLAYRVGTPPECKNFTVSPVILDGQYQYHIDLTYKK